jgi:membrane-bound metal-dependent hydrolase YbcI (DUF457 family)
MALAYLLAKPAAKKLNVNLNIPLIMVLSLIPDIDILAGVPELHRGPTHSIIVALIIFIPFFVAYRRKAAPYFIALASHSLIGDFFIGGQLMLLWPLTSQLFGLRELGLYISIRDPINIALELTLFTTATVIMLRNKDLFSFAQNKKSNLLLIIPIVTVLLPTFASYPLQVPIPLIPPHLFYLALFSLSVLTVILRVQNRQNAPNKAPPQPASHSDAEASNSAQPTKTQS